MGTFTFTSQLSKWEVKNITRDLESREKESALWLNLLLVCMWLQIHVCYTDQKAMLSFPVGVQKCWYTNISKGIGFLNNVTSCYHRDRNGSEASGNGYSPMSLMTCAGSQ